GSARVWEVRPEGSAEWIGRDEKDVMTGVAYSPDGSTLVTTGHSGEAVLLDASSGRPIHRYPRTWDGATFSADGATLVTSGGVIRVLDLATGKATASAPSGGGQVALAPDGRSFATGDRGGVAVRDLATGKRIDRYGPTTLLDETKDVAFSPDGSMLAGISGLATVRVWDVTSGQTLLSFQGQTGQGHDIAFSPDGSVLAVSGGGGITWWRVPSGEAIATLSTSGSVQAAEFSPDGALLATAGDDGITRVWDVATRQEVLALSGHTDAVLDVGFSPDGTRLATVGVDGTLRVYVLSIRDLSRVARSRLTRGLTDQECQQYLHVSACPSAPS
ncbi:MAG: WD40 repeat domain-containing protein, partial [Actinomycetota bacterium]